MTRGQEILLSTAAQATEEWVNEIRNTKSINSLRVYSEVRKEFIYNLLLEVEKLGR